MNADQNAPRNLHQLIEQQVARAPQLEALRFDGQSLSYAELDRRANQCAHYLRELGVGPDTIVGVFMERSLELVVALVAILKAGGAYLPLDTGYPEARLQFLLDDAQVSVVLTQQRQAPRLAGFSGTVLPLDSKAEYLGRYSATTPEHVNRPGDLAYVIYTSGSTGQPKGCLLPHGAICNRLSWMQDEYRLRPGDRVLQKTPYTFDVSVWEFFWPLLAGATLVLAAPQGHKDSHYLVRLIRDEGITVCHFVPSMLRFFLNDEDAAACTSLRDVFTSGEALPFDMVQRFTALLPARLHNLYGPTEAAVDVSHWPCEVRPDRKVPIGRAICNIRLYILDAARRPVPRGSEGELYIAGVGLARGYLRRPQLTAERFVDDPFHPGEKMYRTGDRAVELDDGNIDFLGRIDFQVKLRGLRIELGEIESVLRRHDGVREAAVLVRGEDEGDPKLVAYLEAEGALEPRQVRGFVARTLPEYMVPSLVVTMPKLPVTVHGKLDRGALPWPVPVAPAPTPAPARELPALKPDAVQARIGELVAAVIKQDRVDGAADLFDLGATSLTLVRMAEQIRNEFGTAVPLEVFLDTPTVAGVAAYVVQQGGQAPVPAGLPCEAPAALSDIALPPVAFRVDALVPEYPQACFSGAAVAFETFSTWLGLLMAGTVGGQAKYRYPSGGGLNPVRAYVYVKEDGVARVPAGAYYYHPESHLLVRVGPSGGAGPAAFGEQARRLADAAFAVFFIAEMAAVEPLYGPASAALVTLDAGYMSQLLLGEQAAHGLASSPVADLDVEGLRPLFDLSATERFVHALWVGRAAPVAPAPLAGGPAVARGHTAAGCVQHPSTESLFAASIEPAASYEQMRQERRHLRLAGNAPTCALAPVPFNEAEHRLRACRRDYEAPPVGIDALSRLLGLVRRQASGGERQYLYGAAGASRSLVVYVYLRGGEIAEGLYRYDAAAHCLAAVGALTATQLEQAYTPYNRRHLKQGSFCLFVFGRLPPQMPRQAALHAGLLDAGHLGQLMMERQAEFGLGLCPIGAIRFDRIQQAFGLPPGLELLHSFVGGVAAHDVPASRRRIEATGATAQDPRDDIAIIGLSGRYPGAADLRHFWRNLRAGHSSIGPWPTERAEQHAGAAVSPGGYLPDIASFDSLLFGIAPVEARSLDPQERMLLEEVWAALEDAGYTAQGLASSSGRVGVFVGAMWNDYQSVGLDRWRITGKAEEFSHHASLANRVSFVFDFAGPSVAVNTSCSSGLTALHMACESLRRGECEAAIVGGVNLLAHAYHPQMLKELGLLSEDGRARPLSAQASGWVPGEGVGVVVLRRLRAAQRDGDHIHAIVRASCIGHGGRSPRYGAPHVQRQGEHLRQLLADAGLAPADIGYIELAAPGASLADAAELGAIGEVFGRARREAPCHLGTIKANIGHLESASGLSQLTKVVLQLQHGELAPSLGSEPRNPLIALDDDALRVVTAATPWPPAEGRPRHAVINAIGAAGSAAHLVVSEYLAPQRTPSHDDRQVVLLSAATAERLTRLVERLRDFLSEHPATSITDLAFTLRVGRVAMQERLALVVDSVEALRQRLQDVLAGRASVAAVTGDDLDHLAAAWVQGQDVDWRMLERPGQQRMSLPTYPFEPVRHWLDAAPPGVGHAAQPGLLQEAARAFLVQQLAQATGIPASRIGVDKPLETLGLNSMIIQQLNARLAHDFPDLPKTVFFEHRSLRSLAAYLVDAHEPALRLVLGKAGSEAVAAAPMAPVRPQAHGLPALRGPAPRPDEAIAIVGLSGRYPQADDLDAFWRNLVEGKDCIEEIPRERWDYAHYAPRAGQAGKFSRWGGFLRDADAFDPLFFGISPLEAERMDPQERLVLESVWHTFEDAGYNRAAIEAAYQNQVGVFIGVMYGEYQLYPSLEHGLGISGTYGTIANRVSYVLDLRGPSMAVDTMCSSSLTALHLACESIRRGECLAAIAGGVNLSLHPNKYATHAMLNMPSSDGRCRAFGAGGDGFVAGEGVGTVLLKPLQRAIADGDNIHGVIRATAVNHGGKTNGYTVPNPDAQMALVATALQRAGVPSRAVSYVEAHGTGTALGDPIEIAGLSRAFGASTDDGQFCAIGSVKSNIGHAESAAGIAGLTKVLLQFRHGRLVPSLHAQETNPNIDFARTPFFVQREAAEWRRPVVEIDGVQQEYPRLAGISSFGAGGSNAHVIVEEFRPPESPRRHERPAGQPCLIVLSARNEDRLREQVRQLLAAVEAGRVHDGNLADAAYTLQVGREAMDDRLAMAVDSADELMSKLKAVLAGTADIEGVHRGQSRRSGGDFSLLAADEDMGTTVDAWIRKGKHSQLLDLWVKRFSFDWRRLYGERTPRRISLPTYPFARDRYWVAPRPAEPSGHRRPAFDRQFFDTLFKDVESDQLSIESALAQAHKRT